MEFKLKPEVEQGNIEYKRKITNPTSIRIDHLTTQMKWRLNEGNGEAIYYIGVEDDGSISGIKGEDLKESIKNIKYMIKSINGKLIKIEKNSFNKKNFYKIIIHKKFLYEEKLKFNFIFLGSSQSGKSTLISYFIYGNKDNGNGSSRLSLFNHQHEMFTGKTSSISLNTIGLKNKKILNFKSNSKEEILKNSNKIITLIDVPGHTKYSKTTFNALLSHNIDFIFILVDLNNFNDSINYIRICMYFKIKFTIIFNKSDILQKDLNNFILKVKNLLNINLVKYLNEYQKKLNYYHVISCVSLNGIDKLNNFFCEITNYKYKSNKSITNSNEIQIMDTFYVYNIGIVIFGLVINGIIKKDKKYYLGPFKDNKFKEIKINSIHKFENPIIEVKKLNNISITIDFIGKEEKIKKDMIITDNIVNIKFYNEIRIELILIKKIKIKKGNVFTMFIRNMIRLTEILEINEENQFLIKVLNKDIITKNNDKIIIKGNDIIGYGKVIL